MKHGIVSLAKLLPGWQPPPETASNSSGAMALKAVAPRVIGDPAREPVNKQAAMLLTRAHHLELPPFPPAEPIKGELDRLRAENAQLQVRNNNLLAENAALKRRVNMLQKPAPPVKQRVIPPPIPPPQPDQRLALLEKLSDI